MHIAFRQNWITEFMTSDKLCQILVLCYFCLTVTTLGIFSRDTVKTFLEIFLQHITNHYDKHRDLYCIYLFVYFWFFFYRNLRLFDLVPAANSVPEVRSCASIQNAFLLPLIASRATKKFKSGNERKHKCLHTHTTFITSKREEL
jgi:hypothetical protein